MLLLHDQTILNGPQVTMERLLHLLRLRCPSMLASVREQTAAAYVTYGTLTTIGSLIPFAQAIHETGWFQSARWTNGFNPAGIGATNDGAWGQRFASSAAGVYAQYAHLLCYAGTNASLPEPLRTIAYASPRLFAVEQKGWRGIAPRWVDLNGRWAYPGTTYGETVLKIAREIAG